jgi:hypothetical protein
MPKLSMAIGAAGLAAVLFSGCTDWMENQTKKTGSIIGKKTDEIQKFDPNAKQEVSDSKVRADDPLLYGMQAYGPIVEQISKLNIDYALRLYEAEHEHYPLTHEEFMTGVIKPNHIKLPVLPAGWKYAYDVENHKLEVVRPVRAAPKVTKQPPGAAPVE